MPSTRTPEILDEANEGDGHEQHEKVETVVDVLERFTAVMTQNLKRRSQSKSKNKKRQPVRI